MRCYYRINQGPEWYYHNLISGIITYDEPADTAMWDFADGIPSRELRNFFVNNSPMLNQSYNISLYGNNIIFMITRIVNNNVNEITFSNDITW